MTKSLTLKWDFNVVDIIKVILLNDVLMIYLVHYYQTVDHVFHSKCLTPFVMPETRETFNIRVYHYIQVSTFNISEVSPRLSFVSSDSCISSSY